MVMQQVIKPLLPKSKAKDEPRALRSFTEAERLLVEDTRFLRVPARDRCCLLSSNASTLGIVEGRCQGCPSKDLWLVM